MDLSSDLLGKKLVFIISFLYFQDAILDKHYFAFITSCLLPKFEVEYKYVCDKERRATVGIGIKGTINPSGCGGGGFWWGVGGGSGSIGASVSGMKTK